MTKDKFVDLSSQLKSFTYRVSSDGSDTVYNIIAYQNDHEEVAKGIIQYEEFKEWAIDIEGLKTEDDLPEEYKENEFPQFEEWWDRCVLNQDFGLEIVHGSFTVTWCD
jgi:hypothetical protein